MSVIHTTGTFRNAFPVLGNMVLQTIFAVSISMVYFATDFRWINDQQPDVAHPLCNRVFNAINIVLMAHELDYPSMPIERGTSLLTIITYVYADCSVTAGLSFLHFIVQWAIDEIVGHRNKVKLWARVFVCLYGVSPRQDIQTNLEVFRRETHQGHYLHLWFDEVSLSNYLQGSSFRVCFNRVTGSGLETLLLQ
jgi:hypothetical protein